MFRTLSAAAAIALSVQAASASSFSASVSAGDADRTERVGERQGAVSLIMNRVATMIIGNAARAGDGTSRYQFHTDKDCDATKTADKKTPKQEEEAKKAEPIGPEPIYYGF